MNSMRLNVTVDIALARSFLRPHEIALVTEIDEGMAARGEFKEHLHDAAGKILRDMMEVRTAQAGAGKPVYQNNLDDFGKYGPPNWPSHPNCRCTEAPVINITTPLTRGHGVVGGHGYIGERAHKPVTRKEAARAVRAVLQVERDKRLVDRKTKRTLAAVKGWETRTRNRRLKKAAAKRKGAGR